MKNYVSSSCIFTLIITITTITLTNLPTSQCRFSKEYNICSQKFTCGNITGLSYPFYTQDRPSYCGHPGFELLDCNQQAQFSHIMILSQKFFVLDINTTSFTINVARDDFKSGSGCPLTLTNITIDFSIFQYAPQSANLTLLYHNCSSKCGFAFPCPLAGGSNLPVCYFTAKMLRDNNITEAMCPDRLFLPVHLSEYSAMDAKNAYFPAAAWNGFDLKWSANNVQCGNCLKSGGQCGHDLKSNKFFCFCSDESKCPYSGYLDTNVHRIAGLSVTKFKIVLLACCSVIGIGLLLTLVLCLKARHSSKNQGLDTARRNRKVDVEAFLRNHGSTGPRRYSYNDLKKITNSFKDKLGEGGYGIVYKGQLQNGNLVAVKILYKSKEANEFINEVASIGQTNHVNVVTLLGFCNEGQKRALVYEFMANGSLEKFLYAANNHHALGWEKLYQIAIGIAKGLEYLHRGCNIRIMHFDIKPHNILLDENFCPKISDFGLAKLCPQKDSLISMSEARGTVGYIAPEVFLKSFGGVSYKSDVYSYGMLVLEMVGCRRKVEVEGELSSEQSFPEWIYMQLEAGEELDHHQGIVNGEGMDIQRKMILVSLWCVKTNPSSRPDMSKVVEMLEGTIESVPIPRVNSLSLSS